MAGEPTSLPDMPSKADSNLPGPKFDPGSKTQIPQAGKLFGRCMVNFLYSWVLSTCWAGRESVLVPSKCSQWGMILTVWQGREFIHLCWPDSRNSAGGKKCQQILCEASPLTIWAGGRALASTSLDSPEASASSTDGAADGTHFSADDILIYLSLTDGTMPWFLAGVQNAGQLSGDNRFYKWMKYWRLNPRLASWLQHRGLQTYVAWAFGNFWINPEKNFVLKNVTAEEAKCYSKIRIIVIKRKRFKLRESWIQVPALPRTSSVTQGSDSLGLSFHICKMVIIVTSTT